MKVAAEVGKVQAGIEDGMGQAGEIAAADGGLIVDDGFGMGDAVVVVVVVVGMRFSRPLKSPVWGYGDGCYWCWWWYGFRLE